VNKNSTYFIILILVLCGTGIFAVLTVGKINLAYQGAIGSWLQAQILQNYSSQITHNFRIAEQTQYGSQRELSDSRQSSIIFVGDVMLSRFIQTQIERNGNNYIFPFASSTDFLNSADAVFGNFEGTISARGKNQGSVYSFRSNPEVVKGLQAANFKIMSLANNHIWDWGKEALLDTVAFLKTTGIESVGAGGNFDEANSPAILDINGTKIAFFAFTNLYPKSLTATRTSPGISSFDAEVLKDQINGLRTDKKADIIAVSFHWGDEYATSSNSLQKNLAHQIIDAGADLVIGGHPHVVEESEQYKGKWIFYSLGNFVFDQNFSKETMEGLAVKITLKDRAISNVERYKILLNKFYQPYETGLFTD
jgi:poly-gamma-glutamate synthesis protein (capsule biosynthesis protein)